MVVTGHGHGQVGSIRVALDVGDHEAGDVVVRALEDGIEVELDPRGREGLARHIGVVRP